MYKNFLLNSFLSSLLLISACADSITPILSGDTIQVQSRPSSGYILVRPKEASPKHLKVFKFNPAGNFTTPATPEDKNYFLFQSASLNKLKSQYKQEDFARHFLYYGNSYLKMEDVFANGIQAKRGTDIKSPTLFGLRLHQIGDDGYVSGLRGCISPAVPYQYSFSAPGQNMQIGYIYKLLPLSGGVYLNKALENNSSSPDELEFSIGAKQPGYLVAGALKPIVDQYNSLPVVSKHIPSFMNSLPKELQKDDLLIVLNLILANLIRKDPTLPEKFGNPGKDYLPFVFGFSALDTMNDTAINNLIKKYPKETKTLNNSEKKDLFKKFIFALARHPVEAAYLKAEYFSNPAFNPDRISELN